MYVIFFLESGPKNSKRIVGRCPHGLQVEFGRIVVSEIEVPNMLAIPL
jgi:hypothetical protein